VVRALTGEPADLAPFGTPAAPEEVAAAVTRVLGVAPEPVDGGWAVPADPRLAPLAFAHGWRVEEGAEKAVIQPITP
jgi:coenzyme F420-0:L-glutamate ligase/coenzyme F420-1:gamma-L-glutamate ligase